MKGLEPSTPGATVQCSNQLSYTHHDSNANGAPEGTRTPDPRLRRPLLYPPELLALKNSWPRSEIMITDAALGTGLQKSCKRVLPLAPDDPSRCRTNGATNRVIPKKHTCCCNFGIESFFGSGLARRRHLTHGVWVRKLRFPRSFPVADLGS